MACLSHAWSCWTASLSPQSVESEQELAELAQVLRAQPARGASGACYAIYCSSTLPTCHFLAGRHANPFLAANASPRAVLRSGSCVQSCGLQTAALACFQCCIAACFATWPRLNRSSSLGCRQELVEADLMGMYAVKYARKHHHLALSACTGSTAAMP